jgi:molecular chaperone DnaK (HSP70)
MKYRQAVAQAASLANVTVLQFIHETPAAALYHTMSLPLEYKGKKMFINSGAWRTQVIQ